MLEEGNQRRGHRYRLARRDVHVLNALARHQRGLVAIADPHQRLGESALFGQSGVGLGDHVLAFLDSREVVDDVGDLAVGDPPVGRFQDAVFVGARINRQRVDQADVRTFRGLDRTHAAVVGGMHVSHLEAGPLPGQAAGAQRGDPALVGGFRQRVVLVHELRQLVRTEKLLDGRRYRLGVDHLLRHQAVALGHGQALLDRPLDPRQALAQRVLGHLAHAAHPAVAEVVDVVDVVLAVADAQQHAEHLDDVFRTQDRTAGGLLAAHPAVELHPAHAGQVVAVRTEEQVVEQVLCRLRGGRLAGAHHLVDLDQRHVAVAGLVHPERGGNVRTVLQFVDVDGLDRADAVGDQAAQNLVVDLVVGLGEHFAGFGVHHVAGQGLPEQRVGGFLVFGGIRLAVVLVLRQGRKLQPFQPRFLQQAHVALGNAAVPGRDQLAAHDDVEARGQAPQARRLEPHPDLALLVDAVLVALEEQAEYLLGGELHCPQKHGGRDLLLAVNAGEHAVLGVELEVQPGSAVGNDAGVVQQLAGRMGLAAVVVEEHARGAVQLGHDDPVGAVDDEAAVPGHQRDLAQIDLLLADFLDRPRGAAVEDDQAHHQVEWRCVGSAA